MGKYLCSADWHLMDTKPPCRVEQEDYQQTQLDVLDWIKDIAYKYEVDGVICAGDLFDKPNMRDNYFKRVIANKLNRMPKIYAIAGAGHDFLQGDTDKGTFYHLLADIGVITDVSYSGYSFSTLLLDGTGYEDVDADILIAHTGLYYKEKPYANAPDSDNVENFVAKYKNTNCKYIISGHYHIPFIYKIDGITVINCGSLFRTRANQVDYKPSVWIVDTEANYVKQEYVPLKYPILRDHIDKKKEQEQYLEEIIGSVSGDFEIGFDFKTNLKNIVSNSESKYIKEIMSYIDKSLFV